MKLYGQHLPHINDTKKEATLRLLHGLWQLDTYKMPDITHAKFVYFFPDQCRFIIVPKQLHKHLILKVDPFEEVSKERAIEIVSFKYPFSEILVGVFVKRRLMTQTTFLHIVMKKPEWFEH